MKPARFDSGLRWGDPNLRWGSPSVVLEPGDPGYVPPPNPSPASPAHETKYNRRTMSSNPTPRNPKVLRALAHDIADGLQAVQDTIGMKQNRDTDIRAALKKLEGDPTAPAGTPANMGSILQYEDCVKATAVAEKAVRLYSDGEAKKYLAAARAVFADLFGSRWSTAWVPTGFPNNSTAVPESHDQRFALLASLRAYFVQHPDHELNVPAPHTAVTAAAALAVHTQFSNLRAAANDAAGEQAACRVPLDADYAALSRRVSGTLAELRQILPADDSHWETLGLNIPAHPSTPVPVSSVTLSPAGAGKVLAEWAHARRAEYYRIFLKVLGTDADFRFLDRSTDLEEPIKGLPTGATVEVRIVSANEGGEAAPSPAASAVVG